MTLPNQEVVVPDAWDEANNATPPVYEFFGRVQFSPWNAFFPGKDENGGSQKPVVFNPQVHDIKKMSTIIDAVIIPISQQNITKEVKQNFTSFSSDWTRIVLPSIKALPGITGIRDLHDKYVRVQSVPGKRKRLDKDTGEDTGEFWSTWKFVEVFANEAACVAAYEGAGYSSATEPEPIANAAPVNAVPANDPGYQTALSFAAVVVKSTSNGKSAADFETIKTEVANKITGMPQINKYLTGDSPEVLNLIMDQLAGK